MFVIDELPMTSVIHFLRIVEEIGKNYQLILYSTRFLFNVKVNSAIFRVFGVVNDAVDQVIRVNRPPRQPS